LSRISGEERGRGYTEQATEDLLFRVLEKEFREAMQDVLEGRLPTLMFVTSSIYGI